MLQGKVCEPGFERDMVACKAMRRHHAPLCEAVRHSTSNAGTSWLVECRPLHKVAHDRHVEGQPCRRLLIESEVSRLEQAAAMVNVLLQHEGRSKWRCSPARGGRCNQTPNSILIMHYRKAMRPFSAVCPQWFCHEWHLHAGCFHCCDCHLLCAACTAEVDETFETKQLASNIDGLRQ